MLFRSLKRISTVNPEVFSLSTFALMYRHCYDNTLSGFPKHMDRSGACTGKQCLNVKVLSDHVSNNHGQKAP